VESASEIVVGFGDASLGARKVSRAALKLKNLLGEESGQRGQNGKQCSECGQVTADTLVHAYLTLRIPLTMAFYV